MTTVALAVLLVAGMLAVGTTLDTDAFARLAARPAPLVGAVVANLVLLPLAAVVVLALTELPPPVALGVLLAAAAAGGSSGPLLAHHAGGTLALAVTLQAVLALLAIAAVPAWLLALPGQDGSGLGRSLALSAVLLAAQALPLAAGMALRVRSPDTAQRVHTAARRLADLLLAAVVLWYLVTAFDDLLGLPPATVPAITLVVLVSLTAYWTPWLRGPAERAAVSITTVVRNLTLALMVAALGTDPERTITAVLTYGLVMYIVAGLAIPVLRSARRRAARGQNSGRPVTALP